MHKRLKEFLEREREDEEAELLQERMTSQQLLKELRDLRDKASFPLPGMALSVLPYS